MSPDELRQLIALGREFHGIEYKCAGHFSDKTFRATLVRAILAMANRAGGGMVVVGVGELAGTQLEIEGLSDEQRTSWTDFDSVSDSINSYADPHVEVTLEEVLLGTKALLVFKIAEFEQTPVLCKKDCQGKLRNGACYVRGRNKPESIDVPTYTDMRELLDLAIQKAYVDGYQPPMLLGLTLRLSVGPMMTNSSMHRRSSLQKCTQPFGLAATGIL